MKSNMIPVADMRVCVLVAWNRSVEAAGAATAALPLLCRAEAVQIVTSGSAYRAGPPVFKLDS